MLTKIETNKPFVEALETELKDAALPALTREYIHDSQRDRETERHLEHRQGKQKLGGDE